MARGGKLQNPNDPEPIIAYRRVTRKPSQNLKDRISKLVVDPIWQLIVSMAGLLGLFFTFFGITVRFTDFIIALFIALLVVISLGFAVLIFVLVMRRMQIRQSIDPSQRNPTKYTTKSLFIRRFTFITLSLATLSLIVAGFMSFRPSPKDSLSNILSFQVGGSTDAFNSWQNSNYQTFHSYVDVKYSQDGKYIAAVKRDGTVNKWDAADGKLLFTYNTRDNAIHTIALSPDDLHIALSDYDGKMQILNATNRKQVSSPYDGKGGSVSVVSWSPNGSLIASGYDDGTVHVWGVIDGRTATVYTYPALKKQETVYAVAWSPNGLLIASGYDDGTVQIWDATSGKNIATYSGHQGAISSIAWSPDGTRIASGSYDDTVQVWDAARGGKNVTIIYNGHSGTVNAVAWSSDGNHIASGGDDNTVQVWDAADGVKIITYSGHHGSVNALAWSSDNMRIASASADGTIRVWSATSGSTICNLPTTPNKKCP